MSWDTSACCHGHPYVDGSWRASKDGIRVCKICDRARCKRWRDANPDKMSAANKAWRAAHIEYARYLCRRWHALNSDLLTDAFIKKRLRAEQGFIGGSIPQGIIRLIREHLKTERVVKQLQKGEVNEYCAG